MANDNFSSSMLIGSTISLGAAGSYLWHALTTQRYHPLAITRRNDGSLLNLRKTLLEYEKDSANWITVGETHSGSKHIKIGLSTTEQIGRVSLPDNFIPLTEKQYVQRFNDGFPDKIHIKEIQAQLSCVIKSRIKIATLIAIVGGLITTYFAFGTSSK